MEMLRILIRFGVGLYLILEHAPLQLARAYNRLGLSHPRRMMDQETFFPLIIGSRD
jgi:hypothetical protein